MLLRAILAGAIVMLVVMSKQSRAETALVRDGRSDHTIMIDRNCTPSEGHAAEQLQSILEQISGAKLPISQEPAAGPMIFVGLNAIMEKLSLTIDDAALGDEGFVIKTVGNHLVLAGGRKRGAMYACYEFLDRFLRCRWFASDCHRIPRRRTIILPDIDYQKVPVFEYRHTDCTESKGSDWRARNRMNHFLHINWHARGEPGFVSWQKYGGAMIHKSWCHTFLLLVPPDKYFQRYPEYFSEVNPRTGVAGNPEMEKHPEYFSKLHGKRAIQFKFQPGTGSLCLTNPKVVEVATEEALRWLRQTPEATYLSVSQNDQSSWCQCDKCTQLAEREGSLAGLILHFVNQVADNISQQFPDVLVSTLAYAYSSPPPKHVKPRPNVVIRYVTGQCIAPQIPVRQTKELTEIPAWSNITDHLYIWDYTVVFNHYLMSTPNLYTIPQDIRFFAEHNVKGVFLQANRSGGGELAELRSYLFARCLWDPFCDWRAEIQEFLAAYYGKAAEPIGDYIDALNSPMITEHPDMKPVAGYYMHTFDGPAAWGMAQILTKQFIEDADVMFDRAEAAVADDPQRLLRVRKERLGLRYVQITRRKEFFSTPEQFKKAVEEFARVASLCDIIEVSDGQPLAPRIAQWREEARSAATENE